VYKPAAAGPTHLQLAVAYDSAPETFVTYDVGNAASTGWNEAELDLGGHVGDRILAIGLRFVSNGEIGYTMEIGRIAVEDGAVAPPDPPSNVVIERRTDEIGFVTLRLRWDHSPSSPTYYNVYRYNPDETRTYLGGTPNDAYFVQMVPPAAGDSLVTIAVEAVGSDFAASTHATTTFLVNPAVGVGDSDLGAPGPHRFAILPNHPNPFRSDTQIRFELPDAAPIDVTVYDALGRSVKTLVRGPTPAGSHVVEWDGRDDGGRIVASGAYFVRMRSDEHEVSRKILRVK
jgi:hypothetical protein